ncbi:SDR family NAD(P)-dependent oxidoreductase [Okeania sp. KiyG1]|uniref:SDR family NAD(P)-dependent oxidoreductase n=1 Tax=Okeania sp. KiyG1 TaxID=2720165 RepID=UPI0019236C79|nr:SDR family NAD(P)-dependent oxidoreductase [Okeania sp. KiyG1]GGA50153.1 NAD-dependent epimerase [Okeania sp. KiyG1]
MINLSGKIILITGASTGIGAATAQTLAKAGANVILHYGHKQQEAEAIATQIGQDKCYLLKADLAEKNAGVKLWVEAIAWQGRIDILVNNAGIFVAASVDDEIDIWSNAWQQTLQVNLVAVADLCREAIRHFQTRDGGTIINIASRAAFRGDDPQHIHYAASKGGVISLTRTIARGFAKSNILAYAVAPGFVRTERVESYLQQVGEDFATRDIPLGKLATPEDVANVVAFLASGLAPHATGATIDINGASYVC